MTLRAYFVKHTCRKSVSCFLALLLMVVSILLYWRYLSLQKDSTRLERFIEMAELALEQKKAKLALKALAQEEFGMEDNKQFLARADWLRFKAYSSLDDIPRARQYAANALALATSKFAHEWMLEFALWSLDIDSDLDEAKKLIVEGISGFHAYSSLIGLAVEVLLNLPSPNLTEIGRIATLIQNRKLSSNKQFKISGHVIGSLYGILRNTSAMLLHFGMTCRCANVGSRITYRAFGHEVAEAYENYSLDPLILPEVQPDDKTPIVLSKPSVPIEIARELEDFFFSSAAFWPRDERRLSMPSSSFSGHLRALSDPETTLIDSVIAKMHSALPAWLRARATHAEWWSHARPHQTFDGQRQFFQGHACHTDDYDHEEGVALATSVFYLSDSTAATLVINQSIDALELDPNAWVVHPKRSFMITFEARLWHCVLPPKSPEVGSRRVSLNVLWLSQACINENYDAQYCQHRPSGGWPWEAEIQARDLPPDQDYRDPLLWSPKPVRAFSMSDAIRLDRPSAGEL